MAKNIFLKKTSSTQDLSGYQLKDDDVEAGVIEFQPRTDLTPVADSKHMFMTTTGETPNQHLVLKVKNELGEDVIVSSLIK